MTFAVPRPWPAFGFVSVAGPPSAGISTVHIPYGRPEMKWGWVWTNNGSPSSYQVSKICRE